MIMRYRSRLLQIVHLTVFSIIALSMLAAGVSISCPMTRADISISIEPDPGDTLTPTGSPFKVAEPGDYVYFDIQVRNLDDVPQRVTLTITDGPDWPVSVTDLVDVPPGGMAEARISIEVPDITLDPAATHAVRVEGWSNLTGDRAYMIVIVELDLRIDHRLVLSPYNTPEENVKVYPGEKTFMDITLSNLGNMNDRYILKIQEHQSDWDIQFRENEEELEFELGHDGSNSRYMTRVMVGVPFSTSPGEVLHLTVISISLSSDEFGIGKQSDNVDIHFEIVKGASVTINPVETFVQGSEYIDLSYTLHHTGVVESIIDPIPSVWKDEIQLFDWEFLIAPEGPILLRIGETREIQMRAMAPQGSFGYHTIRLDGDSNTADIIPGASTAFLSPRSNITLEPMSGGPFDVGQRIELKTAVHNNGDISKQALLGVTGVPAEYMVEILPSRDLFIEPGKEMIITISIYPKEESSGDPFRVTLTVTASPDEAGAPWQTVASTWKSIDFRELPNLEVRVLTIPSGYIEEGSVIWVNVTVANTGNVGVESLDVIIYEISFYLSNLEVGRKTISLAPGDIRTISYHWSTRISARSLRASIRGPEGLEEMDLSDNDLIESVYVKKEGPREVVQGEDGSGWIDQETAAVGGLGIGLLAAILVFFGTRDVVKYPALVGLIPLYSKLRPEHILNNRLRKRIYVYVQNHPGEHFRSILSHLNLTNGTLAHHLYTLEKEDLIRSQRDGLYRRFYPAGYQIDPGQVSLTIIQKRIMDKVTEEPGLSQKEISEKLDLSNSTVNYNIKSLRDKELIEVRKEGKSTQIYPL